MNYTSSDDPDCNCFGCHTERNTAKQKEINVARHLTKEERIEAYVYENRIANKSGLKQSRGYCEALVEGEMKTEEWTAKQKEINEMHVADFTRADAIKKCHGINHPECLIQALEALGLIKFKEPELKIVKLYEETTMFSGTIRLETWPEGLVLWVGGRIAWKNFS